jgi:hypothetical protein
MSMQVLPTAPSPTVTHLMNLAVLIAPLFLTLLLRCLLRLLDACLFSVGCSGGYGQVMPTPPPPYTHIYI